MALNTWASKNLGPDADISRMPSAGGGGDDFSAFSKITYTEEAGLLTFPYTWGELFDSYVEGFRPYFVYDGYTYFIMDMKNESYGDVEAYGGAAFNIVTNTLTDSYGDADEPASFQIGDTPK